MIISGGFNVYPAVVETVLSGHPAVSEVAVVGAHHDRWVEAVVAMVVPADGTTPTAEELIAHCTDLVGAWEVPKHVELVDALPTAPSGKVDKLAIRRRFAEHPELLPWTVEREGAAAS